MELNFSDILSGWRNHLFPPKEIKNYIKKISEERLAICLNCENNSTKGRIGNLSRCKNCGCPLKQKSKALHAECPIKKWLAIATLQESEEINKQLNNES